MSKKNRSKSSIYKQKKSKKSLKIVGIVLTMLLVFGGVSAVATLSKGFKDFSLFNTIKYIFVKPSSELKEKPFIIEGDYITGLNGDRSKVKSDKDYSVNFNYYVNNKLKYIYKSPLNVNNENWRFDNYIFDNFLKENLKDYIMYGTSVDSSVYYSSNGLNLKFYTPTNDLNVVELSTNIGENLLSKSKNIDINLYYLTSVSSIPNVSKAVTDKELTFLDLFSQPESSVSYYTINGYNYYINFIVDFKIIDTYKIPMGCLHSRYSFDNFSVSVSTLCHDTSYANKKVCGYFGDSSCVSCSIYDYPGTFYFYFGLKFEASIDNSLLNFAVNHSSPMKNVDNSLHDRNLYIFLK